MAIQDNKFARQNEANAKRNITHGDQMTIDQQLVRLEEDIRKLKIEFDIYFNSGGKRAPYETRNRVESVIKRLGDERSLTFAQRYQYNSLVARFVSFRELWRRTMQGREEGRDARFHRMAKSVEKVKPVPINSDFSCADVGKDIETVKNVYQALLRAKAQCGEGNDIPFQHFHQQLAAQTARLKEKTGCERVNFSVGVENGQVTFRAKGEK